MLSVALEISSLSAPASNQKPGAPTDGEASSPFAALLDVETSLKNTASQNLASSTAAKPVAASTAAPALLGTEIPVSTATPAIQSVDTRAIGTAPATEIEQALNVEQTSGKAQPDPLQLTHEFEFLGRAATAEVSGIANPINPKGYVKAVVQTSVDTTEPDQTPEPENSAAPDATNPVNPVAVALAPTVNAAAINDVPKSETIQNPVAVTVEAPPAGRDAGDGSAPVYAEGEAPRDSGQAKAGKTFDAEPEAVKPESAVNSKPVSNTVKDEHPQAPQSQPAGTATSHQPGHGSAQAAAASEKPPLPQHDLKPQHDSVPTIKATLDQPQPFTLPQAGSAVAADRTASAPAPQAVALPVAGIAVEIASKAFAGKNRFEIRLDPPELGRIHVRLDVDRNGEITSRVMTDRQDTLDLFRRDAPALERALQDAGLKTANNGLQFSLRDHGFSGRHDQPLPAPERAQFVVTDENLSVENVAPAYRALIGNRAGVDMRV